MVRSDLSASGVAFTIDTETGFDKVIVVDSIYGLGEFIVQGKVIPDEFVIFKPSLENNIKNPIIGKNIGKKNIKLVYAKDGTKEEKVKTGGSTKVFYYQRRSRQTGKMVFPNLKNISPRNTIVTSRWT